MFRYSTQTAMRCIKRWKSSPRILLMSITIGCLLLMYALPFVENARVQGETLQVGEVFVALTNWRFSLQIFSCSIILLFCDLPIVDRFTTNAIIRGSRRAWFAGQTIYVFTTSFLCATAVLLLSVCVALPDVNFADAWNRPVKLIASTGRIAIDPSRMRLYMENSVLKMAKPYAAMIHSYMLLMLMNIFYGIAALVLRMYTRAGSFIVLLVCNALHWASSVFSPGSRGFAILRMLSPHYHASFWNHALRMNNSALPTLNQSYFILVIMILLLIVLGMYSVKKFDFILHEEVTE